MKIYKIVFFGILIGFAQNARTNEGESERGIASGMPASLDAKNELEIVQKIRSRSYRGGSDESDLKVQSQLLKPTRKIAPTIEDESEPASDE